MRFLFACGGTAGHVNPAVGVAGRIRELLPESEILFIGALGKMEMELVPREGYEIRGVPVSNLSRSLSVEGIRHNIKFVSDLIKSGPACRKIIEEFKPDVVIGTGGYVCYPVLHEAAKLGIPTVIHEQNAYPGMTTKALAKHAECVMLAVEDAKKYLDRKDNCVFTGNPVRVSVLQAERDTVNITFSGQRTTLTKVKAGNFKVIADLEGLKKGENVVRLRVVGPDNVTVESMSVQKISITIDDLITVKKPVQTQIINQTSDDSEPYIVQLSQENVAVEGAATLVNKVTGLLARVDAQKVENEMKALTIALIPVDKSGKEVEGVHLQTDKVSVTTVMLNKKTVPLSVPIIGQEHDNLEISYQVPKTITVKGTDAALAAISEVTCETVDLSKVYDDTQIALKPILTDGVTVATDSGNLNCDVTVKGAETLTLEFTESDIVIEDVTEGLVPVVADCVIHVSASGRTSVIETLNREDFTLTASVKDLDAGTHRVRLVCKTAKDLADLEYSPQEIEITISEEAG